LADNLPGPLPIASENEKLLAQQQNLLVLDNWTTFFSSPAFLQQQIFIICVGFSSYNGSNI